MCNNISKLISISLYLLFLTTLSGCVRIIDWAKSNFYQGCCINYNGMCIDHYIKSVKVYDQLSIRATFDVLWLSDEVCAAYNTLCCMHYGKTFQKSTMLLNTQVKRNNTDISFCALTSYDIPLVGDQAEWGLFLCIEGDTFTPVTLQEIDLTPEFRALFGKKYNRFKSAYLVVFNAHQYAQLLHIGCVHMYLYLRAIDKEVALTW
jgi:hypothetical protein